MIMNISKLQLPFLIILASTSLIFAQNNFKENIVDKIAKSNFIFEKVFIHTNKNNYFQDDIIWFKSYVGENNNKPSNLTSLLYVNLLDKDGEVIDSYRTLIKNGVGSGQLYFNDTISSGTYYVQAYTNFMKNYGKSNFFLKKINYLSKNNNIKKKPFLNDIYDVQLFPENGYLVEKENNTVGIKVLKNGKSIDYVGEIKGTENKKITSFKSEYLGMSKCNLYYDENETYLATFIFKDTTITKPLTKAIKNEISLQCSMNNEFVTIKLLGLENTKPSKNKYHLLFHQKNNIINYHSINILDENPLLSISKKDLFDGVNSITLFKNQEPIGERKIFIYKENLFPNLSLKNMSKIADSVVFKFNLDAKEQAFLSIGVLPIKSKINANESTIKTAFLLSPYIKGNIENPHEYFNISNTKKESQIDLLMLTQGFVKYEIMNTTQPLYEFERGFKLKGKLDVLGSNHLALINNKNQLIQKIFLNSKKEFTFSNNAFYNNDEIRISFLKNNTEAIKPKNITIEEVDNNKDIFFDFKINNSLSDFSITQNMDTLRPFTADKNTRFLKEVTVTKKIKNKDPLASRYRSQVFDIGAYYKVDIPEEYIKKEEKLMYFFYTNENAEIKHWGGLDYSLAINGTSEAILYIDGRRIDGNSLHTLNLDIKDIENIMVQPMKNGNKKYQVFTTDDYKNNVERLYEKITIANGYHYPKAYYVPIFDTNYPEECLEVDWISSIITNNSELNDFSISLKHDIYKYAFFIEGFTENGKLISQTITY